MREDFNSSDNLNNHILYSMTKVRTTVTNVEKHLRTPSEHVGRAHEGFDGIINSIKNNDFQTVEIYAL